MYLLDTNVISESRKVNAGRANAGVANWTTMTSKADMFVSVITLMEIEQGILQLNRKDKRQSILLRDWFENTVKPSFADRIFDVDQHIASLCASLHVPDKRPANDALIASTAIVHDLTLVTRNVTDFVDMPVRVFNPFN